MNRDDLRMVEFTIIEKSKPKKGKKTQKKKKKKIGLFHLWGTNVNGKGNEKFYGLIEEENTGLLLEVSFKDIRFLSEDEIEELFDDAEADEEINAVESDDSSLFDIAPENNTGAENEEATSATPRRTRTPRV